MTTAEKIAAALDDDGLNFVLPGGRSLDAAARAEGARITRQLNGLRYDFPDGSGIVACGGGWDLAIPGSGPECYCWLGADQGRHHADCDEYAGPAR